MDYSHSLTPTTKINEISSIHKSNYQELMKYKSNSDPTSSTRDRNGKENTNTVTNMSPAEDEISSMVRMSSTVTEEDDKKFTVAETTTETYDDALLHKKFLRHEIKNFEHKESTNGNENIATNSTTSSTTYIPLSGASLEYTRTSVSSRISSPVTSEENQTEISDKQEKILEKATESSVKDIENERNEEVLMLEGNKSLDTSDRISSKRVSYYNNTEYTMEKNKLSILKKEVDSSELSTSSLGKQKQDNTSSVDDTIAKILEFIIFDKLQESDHSYSSEETTTGSLDSASTKYDQKSKISSLDQVNEQTVGPLPGSSTSSSSKKSSTIERFTDSSSENIKRKEKRKEFKEKDVKSYIPPKNHIKEDALASTFPSNMNEDLGKHTVEELNAHSGSSSNSPYKDIPQAERSENESSKQMKKGVNQNINLIEQTSIILPVIAFNDKLVNHKTTQSTISQQVINLEKSKESYIRPDTTTEVILVSTMDSPKASSASEETMIIYEESQQNGPSTKSNKKSTENLSEDLLRELASSFTLDELLSEEDNRDELNSKD